MLFNQDSFNAVGGSVVLDCLKKEEITGIFVDAIDAIIQGDTPTLNLDRNESAEEEDIDYSEDDGSYTSEDSDIPEVTLGCKVVIRDKNKTTKTYKYDLLNGKLPTTVEIFTGHKIGDYVEMDGEQWKIEDVII